MEWHLMKFANLHSSLPRAASVLLIAIAALLQSGCGGGGSDRSGTAAAGSTSPPTAPTPGGSPAPATPLANEQPVVVDAGASNGINLLYTNVTICTPGDAAACTTIDHVLVDTGSTGLRLFASTLPAAVKPVQRFTSNNIPLVECMQFADGYSWGPVKSVDVKLGGETVRSMAVQIIGDPAYPAVPTDCSSTGPSENTVSDFGSNGVLGIGNFLEDCGSACANNAVAGVYYACANTGCAATKVATTLQVRHPVAQLAANNNGTLIRLPAVPQDGAVSVSGSLVFGIGTATNNGLGAAKIFTVDPSDATLVVTANGKTYASSFVDSGSNANFFPSATTPVCTSGFYCPASQQTVAAVLQGRNGVNASVDFTFDNADTMFRVHPTYGVLPMLAGPAFDATAVDLGLPLFLGRSVYTAIEGRSTPGGVGPYIAF
jgi:hypothetical protein